MVVNRSRNIENQEVFKMANNQVASFTLKDNTEKVLRQFEANIPKALTAVGMTAVEVTTDYMRSRYYRAIYKTGDLIRDVNFKVRPGAKAVDIGNSLNYAQWVHNGTTKMVARPYIRDAIINNPRIWEEVFAENLSSGFK